MHVFASAFPSHQVLLLQTIKICEAWLGNAPRHEFHLWAHLLALFAKLNLTGQPKQLRKVSLYLPYTRCFPAW